MNGKKRNQYLLQWLREAKIHNTANILWSGGYEDAYGIMEGLLALGSREMSFDWESLNSEPDRLHVLSLSYDAKNDIEPSLHSNNLNLFHRPNLEFIEPERWEMLLRDGEIIQNEQQLQRVLGGPKAKEDEQSTLRVKDWDGKVKIKVGDLSMDLEALEEIYHRYFDRDRGAEVHWDSKVSKEDYYRTIDWIKSKIVAGDFYEMNYCISFESTANIDPYWVFFVMAQVSAAPMMCFVKRDNYYLMSSSMERYMRRIDSVLVSQPIKGTIKNTAYRDDTRLTELGKELHNSVKDRAENTMIVDLVRNDLSRVCEPGSVRVPEWCGVYAYPHVLQMISTVVGELRKGITVSDIVKATFPMGSMTGAPKIEVMKQCEYIESFQRGLYSGSVGWMFGKHMDLNVIIRALQYDANSGALQYAVGGAITIDSEPEEEYQECAAKAQAMLKTLVAAGYSTSNL